MLILLSIVISLLTRGPLEIRTIASRFYSVRNDFPATSKWQPKGQFDVFYGPILNARWNNTTKSINITGRQQIFNNSSSPGFIPRYRYFANENKDSLNFNLPGNVKRFTIDENHNWMQNIVRNADFPEPTTIESRENLNRIISSQEFPSKAAITGENIPLGFQHAVQSLLRYTEKPSFKSVDNRKEVKTDTFKYDNVGKQDRFRNFKSPSRRQKLALFSDGNFFNPELMAIFGTQSVEDKYNENANFYLSKSSINTKTSDWNTGDALGAIELADLDELYNMLLNRYKRHNHQNIKTGELGSTFSKSHRTQTIPGLFQKNMLGNVKKLEEISKDNIESGRTSTIINKGGNKRISKRSDYNSSIMFEYPVDIRKQYLRRWKKRIRRRLMRLVVSYTECPLYRQWRDWGPEFWPRWVREGRCQAAQNLKEHQTVSDQEYLEEDASLMNLMKLSPNPSSDIFASSQDSCSFPPGMYCQPDKQEKIVLLRYLCLSGWRSKRCRWYRFHTTLITRCKCACLNSEEELKTSDDLMYLQSGRSIFNELIERKTHPRSFFASKVGPTVFSNTNSTVASTSISSLSPKTLHSTSILTSPYRYFSSKTDEANSNSVSVTEKISKSLTNLSTFPFLLKQSIQPSPGNEQQLTNTAIDLLHGKEVRLNELLGEELNVRDLLRKRDSDSLANRSLHELLANIEDLFRTKRDRTSELTKDKQNQLLQPSSLANLSPDFLAKSNYKEIVRRSLQVGKKNDSIKQLSSNSSITSGKSYQNRSKS